MKGAPRRARLRQKIVVVALSLVAGVAYNAATPPVYVARSLIELESAAGPNFGTDRAAQLARELASPAVVEGAAQRLGIRATAREVETEHLRSTAFQPQSTDAIEVTIAARKEEWARGWVEAVVAEHSRRQASALITATPPPPKSPARDDSERARLGRALDELGRLRIQLRDTNLRMIEKLSKIADFQSAHRGEIPTDAPVLNEERLSQLAAQWRDFSQKQTAQNGTSNEELNAIQQALTAELAAAEKQIAVTFQEWIERRRELEGGAAEAARESRPAIGRLGIPVKEKRPEAQRLVKSVRLLSLESPGSFRAVGVVLGAIFAGSVLSMLLPRVLAWRRGRAFEPGALASSLGAPHRGTVPAAPPRSIPLISAPEAPPDEFYAAFTSIAASLQPARKRCEVISFTSAAGREGTTLTAGNLGVTVSKAGNRVLLIEPYAQERALLRLFGFRPKPGLGELLRGETTLATTLHSTGTEELQILGCGRTPFADEISSHERWPELLAELRTKFDLLLIDMPAVLSDTAPLAIHTQADRVVLVVGEGIARADDLRRAVSKLRGAGATVEGFVLNRGEAEERAG